MISTKRQLAYVSISVALLLTLIQCANGGFAPSLATSCIAKAISSWIPADLGLATGINFNTAQSASKPKVTSFNNLLYATWYENNGGVAQIRVAAFNGSTWSFVDGGLATGLNQNSAKIANNPEFAVYNNQLFLTWQEVDIGITNQIRVAVYNGGNSWSFVDGGAAAGINYNSANSAVSPYPYVFNNHLYIIWAEINGGVQQIRVAVYNGGSSWSFVDGSLATGINFNTASAATFPFLTVFNNQLYAFWQELNGGVSQVRATVFNGVSTWNFVDGGLATGLNFNSANNATGPFPIVYSNGLYLTWQETNGGINQVRVKNYTGGNSWSFVDGGVATGLNFNSAKNANDVQLVTFNNTMYLTWDEVSGGVQQIRVAAYSGNSNWSFVDGSQATGLNFSTAQAASFPVFGTLNCQLYLLWQESNGGVTQIHVRQGM